MPTRVTTEAPEAIEPTPGDLDGVIDQLRTAWTAQVTVRRQSPKDMGVREVAILLDGQKIASLRNGEAVTVDVAPGPHILKADNTLFKKTLAFTVGVGEHASFMTANYAGRATYSILMFLMGGNLIYLLLERESLR
ncbi:MAG: hypothetical protein AB7I25_11125 [Vicinamibacterales bacterium]